MNLLEPFRVVSTPTAVDGWSRFRLPFQPRGDALDFRARLQSAIRQLEDPGDRILDCVYTSAATDFVDTENVLIYNVGPSAFSVAARNGLRLQRRFAAPSASPFEPAPGGALHHHAYGFRAVDDPFDRWNDEELIASWTAVWPKRVEVTALWFAIRHGEARVSRRVVGSFIGVRVEIGATVAVGQVLKPVLDAAISAFHVHTDEFQARAVAARIHDVDSSLDPRTVGDELLDQGFNALGERALVSPYRSRWKWNPADELCVAAQVIRRDSGDASMFSGKIFGVSPRSELAA